jgi:hypothetical protein
MKENTGNFRLCKQEIGKSKSNEILYTSNDESDVKNKKKEIKGSDGFEYYCEEEVIYKGTMFDDKHNPIDSLPTWIRMND